MEYLCRTSTERGADKLQVSVDEENLVVALASHRHVDEQNMLEDALLVALVCGSCSASVTSREMFAPKVIPCSRADFPLRAAACDSSGAP